VSQRRFEPRPGNRWREMGAPRRFWRRRGAHLLRLGAAKRWAEWEAACEAAGLPQIGFESFPSRDEYHAYQDKRSLIAGNTRRSSSGVLVARLPRPSRLRLCNFFHGRSLLG
jgi:hypothetical protein